MADKRTVSPTKVPSNGNNFDVTTNSVQEQGGQDGQHELVASEKNTKPLPPHSYSTIATSVMEKYKQEAIARLQEQHSGEKQRLEEEIKKKDQVIESYKKKEDAIMSRLLKLEQFQKILTRDLKENKTTLPAVIDHDDDSKSMSSGYASSLSSQ